MSHTRLFRLVAGGLMAAGVTAVAATSSLAATPTPSTTASAATRLQQLKENAADAVSRRETTLQGLVTVVDNAKNLQPGHKTALLNLLNADETGLNQLNATIQADSTYEQAYQDAKKIVTDYRVYALVVPRVHLVIAADTITAVDARLHTDGGKLAGAINSSKASEDKKQAARELLADFNDQVAAADRDVDGVADGVLDLTAQGYPGNRDQLRAFRDRLHDARSHVHHAREDARQIEALLK